MAIQNKVDLTKLRAAVNAMSASRLAAYVSQLSLRLSTLLNGSGGTSVTPGTPGGFSATGGDEQSLLVWTAAADAIAYEIYRAEFPSQTFTRVGRTPALGFRELGLPALTTQCYKVRAVSIDELPGPFTPTICVDITASAGVAAPTTPTGLTATATGNSTVELTWDALVGTGIAVEMQRKLTAGGTFEQIDTGIVGTIYTDTALRPDTSFDYRIRAINEEAVTSGWSSTVTAVTEALDTTAPPVPSIANLTSRDGAIRVKINGVTASDLLKYQVGIGTVDGGPYTVTSEGLEIIQYAGGLTNGTTYWIAVRSVDTSGNISAWSADLSQFPAAELEVNPPAKPTGFSGTSSEVGTIRLRWDANTESDLGGYNLYSDEANPGKFVVIDTFPVSETFTVRTSVPEGDISYKLAAFDVSANISTLTTPYVLAADGADATGTGEPGGGPQAIDGETGLGPDHKAPGATFDYVVDASGYGGAENAMRAGMALLRSQIANGQVDLSGATRRRVAILLPARTDNGAVELSSQNNYVPGVGGSAIVFPVADTFDVDFVGPWVGGLDLDEAKILVSGVEDNLMVLDENSTVLPTYRITTRYEADIPGTEIYAGLTNAGVSGAVLSERGRLFQDPVGWEGDVNFWCCRFSGGGQQTVQFGYNNSTNGHGINFYCCRFDHDDHIWDETVFATNSSGGSTQVTARFPRWGFSTYGALMSFYGCLMDFPYNQEHAVYDRNHPYGDRTWSYVQVTRCGGQVCQQVFRRGEGNLILDPVSDPGTTFFRHVVSLGYNRNSSWSSAVITRYSAHSLLDLQDCIFADADPSNGSVAWLPPIDPQDPLVGLGVYETFGGIQSASNPDFQGGSTGNYQLPAGSTINGGIKIRNCHFYSGAPDKAVLGLKIAETVDIEDSTFFTGEPGVDLAGYNSGGQRSQSRIEYGDINSVPSAQNSDVLIASSRWVGNNTPALKTVIATYLGLSEALFFDPQVYLKGELIANGVDDVTFTDLRFSGGAPADLLVV